MARNAAVREAEDLKRQMQLIELELKRKQLADSKKETPPKRWWSHVLSDTAVIPYSKKCALENWTGS